MMKSGRERQSAADCRLCERNEYDTEGSRVCGKGT